MIFENPEIPIDSLPRAEEVDFQGLQPAYLNLIYISLLIFNLLFLVAGIVVLHFALNWDPLIPSLIGLSGLIIFLLLVTILEIIGFRYKAYALRDRDIIYKSGVLWKKFTVVPFNRVQHCEVTQGPIEKMLDLGKLKVFTAGGGGSDLAIPGLKHDRAHQLRRYILQKTSDEEE